MTDWRVADRHWGALRARTTYAFRSLLDGGAVLACGSDAPVEPVDPRLAFVAATARTDTACEPAGGWVPDERISIEDAFRGYTVGPAIAAGMRGRLGEIVPGAAADVVAWEGDPFDLAGAGLLDLRCAATFVGGELMHS